MKTLITFIAFLLLSISAHAQTHDRNEIYAIFIFRFTKMTEHPSTGDYKIAIFGNSKVAKNMGKFHNSTSNGRKIIIVETTNIEDTKDASMIFIGDTKSGKIQEIIKMNPTAIIITERNDMLSKGSNISFLTRDDKVAFEVSKTNSEAKGIKLSKDILTYAKRVE